MGANPLAAASALEMVPVCPVVQPPRPRRDVGKSVAAEARQQNIPAVLGVETGEDCTCTTQAPSDLCTLQPSRS